MDVSQGSEEVHSRRFRWELESRRARDALGFVALEVSAWVTRVAYDQISTDTSLSPKIQDDFQSGMPSF